MDVRTEPAEPITNATAAWRRRTLAGLGLVLLALLLLSGARAFNVPDEGRYAEVGREMLRSGDWVTPRLDGVPFLDKPPLFYWLEAASFRAFGVSPWSARLVTSLLGVLACALVAWAGGRLYGARAGALAALVLATSPLWLGASQYVNHDLAVATWITAALLCFAVGERREGPARTRALLLGYAAMGLAILTKGLIGVVLPLGAVGLWLVARRRLGVLRHVHLVAGLGLSAAIAVPWHVLAQRQNPELLHYLFVVQHFQRFTGTGFNNPTGPGFYPLVLLAGILPWIPLLPGAVARAWRAWRAEPEANRTDLLLLLWPLWVVVFFSIPHSKIVGYVLPAVPPLALLVGRHLDAALSERRPLRGALAAAAVLVGVLGAAVAAVPATPLRAELPGVSMIAPLAAGAALLGLSALLALAARRGSPALGAGALAGVTAVVVLAALAALPLVEHGSVRPLVPALEAHLRPGDTIAMYRRYAYDLPLYLDRQEPLVVAERWDDPEIPRRDNWQRELWLGRGWEPRGEGWLVSPAALVERCRPAEARCLVLVRTHTLPELEAALPVRVIGAAGDVSLAATPAAAAPVTAPAASPGAR